MDDDRRHCLALLPQVTNCAFVVVGVTLKVARGETALQSERVPIKNIIVKNSIFSRVSKEHRTCLLHGNQCFFQKRLNEKTIRVIRKQHLLCQRKIGNLVFNKWTLQLS